ncbi:MAG: ribosomal protein L11 methyltransferase [Bermanella sp.]|jgi:ribosomal protein L11 methyltransferase
MPWLQLSLDADRDSAEVLEDALLAVGAAAVTMQDNADQPLYEPGLNERPVWNLTRVTGLFDAATDIPATLISLAAAYGQTLPPQRVEILEDKDWEREWMTHYQPIQCGQRLWICPSWREPVDMQAVNLKLDPGLAFGTGTHPTTFLCLRWLDSQNLNVAHVVDYGCGSGILGIAALLLGASRVTAVDNDPQALAATRDNLQRNELRDERLHCYLPGAAPEPSTDCADIVVANILAGPLIELAPRLASYLKPDGRIALSGILAEQAAAIIERYQTWFNKLKIDEKDGWCCISGIRNSTMATR